MQSIFQTIAEANRQIDSAQSLVSNNLANTGTQLSKQISIQLRPSIVAILMSTRVHSPTQKTVL